jgi:putative membrane protein
MKFSNLLKGMALALACAGMFALTASAQESTQTSHDQMGMKSGSMANGMSTADEHFVKKAAQGGMAEVELGELAQQKAASPEVKRFAQRMVTDHTKANDELKQVASEKNITLPQSLDAKDEATKKKLSALSGEQFDRAYMNDMVNDHTKDVSEFKQESTSAKDPAIKNFAASTLPTLEDHLKEARQIAPKVTK